MYVLEGGLEHKDSQWGTGSVILPGDLQQT